MPVRANLQTNAHMSSRSVAKPQSSVSIIIFFIAAILPISLNIAGMVVDPLRLFLLIMIIPFLLRLATGRSGPMVVGDGIMIAFSLWVVVTLVARHGVDRFPYAVILGVEAFGGYLAGRVMIRSLVEYRRFISYFIIVLFFLAPFAIYELYYSRMPIAEFFRGSFDVIKKNVEYRYDLSRVQVVFPHSILFGLFCSLPIASVFYLYRDKIAKLIIYLSLAVCMTLMSLSSAPLISVFLQIGMISWGVVTKDRWRLLVSILLFLYFVAETFSNRGAVIIFIETFTIDPQTGWWRVYIWRYGSAAVMQHPILGIGLDIYDKPYWLTDSVDNFWLLMALRHGLVGFFLLALVFILHIWHVLRAENLTAEAKMARKGYMITLICVIFSLTTVHVWGVLHVVVMFFLGSGSFFYTSSVETREPDETATVSLRTVGRDALPLTRFSQRTKLSKHPRRQSSASKQPETY